MVGVSRLIVLRVMDRSLLFNYQLVNNGMKICIKIVLLLLIPALGMAQQSHLDSLKKALHAARTDSARYSRLSDLDDYYSESNRDSALYYVVQALTIAKKNKRLLDEASALD